MLRVDIKLAIDKTDDGHDKLLHMNHVDLDTIDVVKDI
jgi:hypothetical protein